MNQTKREQLSANRVYLTEFDRVTYSQVAGAPEDVEVIKQDLTWKLKLLALTKGHVVIAASHLLELAREVILPHLKLLAERVVVQALRKKFSSCEAFLEAKRNSESRREAELYRGTEQQQMAQLIDGTAMLVRWSPLETSDWFKTRLLADLRSDNSLVALHLARKRLKVPEAMCLELESVLSLNRGTVYKMAMSHGNLDFREVICGYADFLYYLSGARAVHSDGVLPQENIVDFHLSDFEEGRSPLSKYEVFFKIFVDTVKAATSTHFPADLLDALSIDDVVSLHHIAAKEEFIQKYNAIQERTKAGLKMSDAEWLVFLMNELLIHSNTIFTNSSRKPSVVSCRTGYVR